MASCQDCNAIVVWLRRSDGAWHPPVEPVLDFADGEYVVASDDGAVMAMPQVYKRHRCLTPQERYAREVERKAEKERLIAEDRERRRVAEELAAFEAAREAERRRYQEELDLEIELENRKTASLERSRRSFKPKRLLQVECRDCGAALEEPCRSKAYDAPNRNTWHFYNVTPHASRFADGPPAGRTFAHPKRWGEDYTGPWPPEADDPGRYEMRSWLAANFTIFDPDDYQERDWLMPMEAVQMTQWLRRNATIFNDETEQG